MHDGNFLFSKFIDFYPERAEYVHKKGLSTVKYEGDSECIQKKYISFLLEVTP